MAGGNLDVKHLWIQAGGGDPGLVSEATAEYPGQLGKVANVKAAADELPRKIQFVKRKATDTTVAAATYNVAYWSDMDQFEVVCDQTLALGGSTCPVVAGVLLGAAPSAGSYGYVQVDGSVAVDLGGYTAADVVVGEPIFALGADTDGKVTNVGTWVTAGHTTAADLAALIVPQRQARIGRALAGQADSTLTVVVKLDLLRNGW